MSEIEMLANERDWTIKLVLFEPTQPGVTGWKTGVIAYPRDEFPSVEDICRVYGEVVSLEAAFSSDEMLQELKKHRSERNSNE